MITIEKLLFIPVGNVRVTIDSDIKTSVNSIDLFNKDLPTVSVIDENMTVLEVKYDEFIPDFIKDLIQINKTTSTAVSKYASSRLYYLRIKAMFI